MDMSPIDRAAINRALAKAIAYQTCGTPKPDKVALWAAELVRLLGATGILKDPVGLRDVISAMAEGGPS